MVAYFPGITAAGTLAPGLAAATVRNTLGLGTGDSPTFAGLTLTGIITTGNVNGSSIAGTSFLTGGSVNASEVNTANNTRLQVGGLTLGTSNSIIFTSGNVFAATRTTLSSPSDNVLEQRNGTNGQRFLLAKTWSSATNHEYLELDAASDASNYRIGSRIGSAGGSTRGLQLGSWNAAGTWTSWLSVATSGNAAIAGNLQLGTTASGGNSAINFGNRGTVLQVYNTDFGANHPLYSYLPMLLAGTFGIFSTTLGIWRASSGVMQIGNSDTPNANGSLLLTNLTASGNITAASLPTSDPAVAGRVWRSGNDLKISTG